MAKWGEGDPRWIVEERPDATNVNNWHWTEKNACGWSLEKIKELLVNLEVASDIGKCTITEVEKCEGEAVANNRKGKLIFFYEWEITLKWKGCLAGESNEVEGTIQIPNLSDENDVSEIDVNVTLKDKSEDGSKLKDFLLKDGKEIIKKQIGQYVILLREEFSKGMILPKKGEDSVAKSNVTMTNLTAGFNKQVHVNSTSKATKETVETTTVNIVVMFQCRSEDFFNALTKLEMVQAFTHGPVKMEPVVGGKFELFGGNIFGEFLELEPGKKIVQRWRSKQWPAEHYSTVTFDIIEKSDHTEVKLVQTEVPQSDAESTRLNWDRYYWEAMKRTFGFGSFFV